MEAATAQDDFWARLLSATQALSVKKALIVAFLTASAVVVGLPFVWMFAVSLQPTAAAHQLPPNYFPTDIDLKSYNTLWFGRVPIHQAYLNSIIISVASMIGVIVTSTMAGFAFSRLEFRGRGPLLAIMLLGLMVPPGLVVIPLYFGFAAIDLLDTNLAIIIPLVVSPFGVYLMRQFMLSQPREYEEAALVEGATYWSIFLRISLPQMMPAVASLAIISFVMSWNNFLLPFVFSRSLDQMTLPLALFNLSYQQNALLLSVMMAGVTVSLAPLLIVFLVAQRYIVEGLTATGLKG